MGNRQNAICQVNSYKPRFPQRDRSRYLRCCVKPEFTLKGSVAWHLNFLYRNQRFVNLITGELMLKRPLWKIVLLLFAIVFQLAETAYASNSHDCCDEAAPCCVIMTSSKTCSPCVAPGITGIRIGSVEVDDVITPNSFHSVAYRSLNCHVIWRPPIE